MEVKDFERYLKLIELKKTCQDIYSKNTSEENLNNIIKIDDEFRDLQKGLANFLFSNQSSVETVLDKLKIRLNRFSEYAGSNETKNFNEIKMVKEILNLIDTYDWKNMNATYHTGEVKQISIWEQNGNGQIRNHKVWNVVE